MKPIAIVGMGCRFAGAPDLHAYWKLTLEGRDAFSTVPADRWPAEVFFDTSKRSVDKTYTVTGAFIEDVRSFPALAFGLPPRRVEVMDPQQRFSIEVALQAIEDAGIRPADLPRRTGVFMGLTAYEYKSLMGARSMAQLMASGQFGEAPEDADLLARAVERVVPSRPFSAPGALGNMVAAAVAQELDLHGPAYTVDAACASALVAVNDAVQQLRAGAIDAAVAGGAYLCLTPDHYIAFSRIGAMSQQGRCLPFDERADGFVQGDGAGAILLKRLEDAERDGDRIYAVIHGAAHNNDGRGDGPMAPVAGGQSEVVVQAWEDAGLDPAELSYVETHGTGTAVGDVSELESLVEALGPRVRRAALGSSKANIGHTMSAAGIAGLIRTALAVHHRTLPPMAGFERPKPALRLDETPFFVPTAPAPLDGLAGVSSFGFGGTNAHLVLGPALSRGAGVSAQPELVLLSAPDVPTLRDLARRTADAVEADPGVTVAGVVRAWAKRTKQPARLGVVARSREELIERLRGLAAGELPEGTDLGVADGTPRLAWLFPGQGSQRLGMLSRIRERFPVVREAMDEVEEQLNGELGRPLSHLLYPELHGELDLEAADAELTDTANCQPVLLACGWALARLLKAVGVEPTVVTGHSLGEFTAAAVAGVLSPVEAARFVARRGRAMAGLPGDHGAMAAVMAEPELVEPLLVDGAVLANVNHPRQVVVSGATEAVEQVVANAEQAGIQAKRLAVSHGFHSPALAGLDTAPLVAALALSAPRIPVASAIDAEPYRDAEHARAVFAKHAVSPVVFTRALEQCRGAGADLYLQVGAGGPLASFARGTLPRDHKGVLTLASLEDAEGPESLLQTLARLWVLGVDVDAAAIAAPAPVASVPPVVLPREVYWAIKDAPQRRLQLDGVVGQASRPPSEEPREQSARRPPHQEDDVATKVIAVVSKVSSYPVNALRPSMALVEDLGFDSLMVGDLATGLADAFPGLGGIPQELLINRPTVQALIDHVATAGSGTAAAHDDDAPLAAWRPTWRPAPLPDLPARQIGPSRVLVTRDGAGLAEAIAAALQAAGHTVVESETEPVDLVVHCAGFVEPLPIGAVLAGEIGWPDLAAPLLGLLDHQAKAGARPDLLVLARDGDPWAEALAGVVRSVGREWPRAVAKTIRLADLDVGAVLAEWTSADRSADVRLVGGRSVAGLEPVASEPWLPTASDTVLVTGGTRGIGALVAARLAQTGAKVIALGSRDADVTDAEALRRAIAPHGPITALVHAAGLLADGALGQVDPAAGRRARDVKVGGFLHAVAACGPDLRVALGLGSWAGRFGNRHQAHYAAGNALLASVAASLPGVRGVVGEFGPWTSSEMAATIPAPVKAAMRAEGVDFVGDAAGIEAILGDLGGAGIRVHGRDLPATSRALRSSELLTVETHPFLLDHAIEGVPVLPLASAADLLARHAELPFTLEDVRLFQGVTVREPTPLTVLVRGDRAEIRVGENEALAYRARIRPAAGVDVEARGGGTEPKLALRTFYDEVTFHGPLLQGITAIDGVGEDFVRGRVRTGTPAEWIPGTTRGAWAIDPLALDSAMQLAAYVAWIRWGRAGTPVGIRRYTQLRPLPAEVVAEVVLGEKDGDRFSGTIQLRDADGTLLALAEEVVAELRAVDDVFEVKPEHVDPASWPEVRDLEQRLEGASLIGLRNPYFAVHQGTARNTTQVDGRELVNFSSYNYLGLSGDPRVLATVHEAVERYGTSVSASRVASGERPFHRELEQELAACQGAEDSLVFTAGHATNVTTIGHLFGPEDLVLHDELIHDSALQGIKLSGAARRQFRHDDPDHLDKQLRDLRKNFEKVLIVIEGVYSMDGDICRFPEYVRLKEKYGCLLFVDEAHSFGIVGRTGQGVREHFGIDGAKVDLWMGTLSKSLASCGGWIAGSKPLITYLRYTAPGFVYSAGLTPANGVAALTSLRLMLEEPWRVEKLQANAAHFHRELASRGLDTGPAHGESGVVPVVTGNSMHALVLSQRLVDQGINVQPIVYPAVADDSARLRFFLSSTHTTEQLTWTAERVADTLSAVQDEFRLS